MNTTEGDSRGPLDPSTGDTLGDLADTAGAGSDARLVELVRGAGVESAEYRYLRAALTETGLGVLTRFGPRRVLHELSRRGLWVPPPPASFHEELSTLRYLAVYSSIDPFMESQVLGGSWDPRGGASLRTFFVNKVLYSFADHYRRYVREEGTQPALTLDVESEVLEELLGSASYSRHQSPDPETVAVLHDQIRRLLEYEPVTIRVMLLHLAEGHTQREIAEELGMSEAAVNSGIRRFRSRLQARMR